MREGRLSDKQKQRAQEKAYRFSARAEEHSRRKGFAEAFRIAALQIEADVDNFCDRAQEVFEEIEAFGQEPQLEK